MERLGGPLVVDEPGIPVLSPRGAAAVALLTLTCGLLALPPLVALMVLLGIV